MKVHMAIIFFVWGEIFKCIFSDRTYGGNNVFHLDGHGTLLSASIACVPGFLCRQHYACAVSEHSHFPRLSPSPQPCCSMPFWPQTEGFRPYIGTVHFLAVQCRKALNFLKSATFILLSMPAYGCASVVTFWTDVNIVLNWYYSVMMIIFR